MKGFIYIIKNSVNDKVYIGQTKNSIEQRWKEHLRHAKYGNQIINRAMKKYGIDKFNIETLETCDIAQLDYKEMYYINLYDSTDKSKGYNVSIGGNTPKFKRKALNVLEVIDLYVNKQFTLNQIANKFEVSIWTIRMMLKNAGMVIRNRHDSASRFNKIPKGFLIEALKESSSLRQAAKSLNIPYTTFRKACIYNNIEYNSSKSARH